MLIFAAMRFISTNRNAPPVSFREAAFKSLAPDVGLYLPETISPLPPAFWEGLQARSFPETAAWVSSHLLGDSLPPEVLAELCADAFNFELPLTEIAENRYVLELFHGPSYAFKDFGARFMARVLAWYLKQQGESLHILVATSGDTGGAVALGFLGMPGIKVTILYPCGGVSHLQEKQLTTLGANITALEVQGSFDDCQRLVKQAFADPELSKKHGLTSANSINLCRLVPQSFYYFQAYKLLDEKGLPLVFSVPSGNFGNLCAGLLAKRIGLPVPQFVAATNANDVFVKFLQTGNYTPRPSVRTLSNAMDVGNPSNYARIADLYQNNAKALTAHVSGYSVSDPDTTDCLNELYDRFGYLSEPHAAVGYRGLQHYATSEAGKKTPFSGVVLGTAHPAKFTDVMPPRLAEKVPLPEGLGLAMEKEKQSVLIEARFEALKEYLNR